MRKKIVGLIVASGITVILLIAVLIGGLRLQKVDKDANLNERQNVRQEQVQGTGQKQPQPNGNNNSSSTGNKQNENNKDNTSKTDSNKQPTNPNGVVNSQNNKQLVDKVVAQSDKIELEDKTPKDLAVAMKPSNATLLKDVYELNGVVKDVKLVTDVNGIQSHYIVTIEVPLGSETIHLEYVTTINSINVLSKSVAVVISYQLTSDNTVAIKGVRLKE